MTTELEITGFSSVDITRNHFLQVMSEGNPIHRYFPDHVRQVEKWAIKIMEYYPEVNREVVLLSVWLHDIGHANKDNVEIHEIFSEQEARNYLPTIGLPDEIIEKVAHCVRTHRCREGFRPESLEGRIVAAADSASHITDFVYINMLNNGNSKEYVLGKLERDFRDTQELPDALKEKLIPLHEAWKRLISLFPE